MQSNKRKREEETDDSDYNPSESESISEVNSFYIRLLKMEITFLKL